MLKLKQQVFEAVEVGGQILGVFQKLLDENDAFGNAAQTLAVNEIARLNPVVDLGDGGFGHGGHGQEQHKKSKQQGHQVGKRDQPRRGAAAGRLLFFPSGHELPYNNRIIISVLEHCKDEMP